MIKKDGTIAEFNNKVMPEKEFRFKILRFAEKYGCKIEVQQIMDKYDKMLLRCTNAQERQQIGIMGAAEIHRVLDCFGSLIVNGQVIIPAEDPDKERQTVIYRN